MRESIGSTWTMQLVFGFILLFVAFLTITISYSKAFRMKNELTSIIEKYGGYTTQSMRIINDYLNSSRYQNTGRCTVSPGEEVFGVNNYANAPTIVNERNNNRYYYCIKKEKINNGTVSSIYYEIEMFYSFSIPVVGNIATFSIKGKTTDISNTKEDLFTFRGL